MAACNWPFTRSMLRVRLWQTALVQRWHAGHERFPLLSLLRAHLAEALVQMINELVDKYKDKIWRIQNLYKIRDKNRQLVKLVLNQVQREILHDVLPAYKAGRGIRHFTLKPRQVGVSTFWMIWHLDDTLFNFNTITGVLAHKWDNIKTIMEIVKIAYDNMPPRLRPPLGDNTKTALSFPTINSKLFSGLSVRSTAVHNLHISEWCFCKDAEIGASLGATSEATHISGESTGNGVGNDGYSTYHLGKKGENAYTVRFFPWYVQDEYKAVGAPSIERLTDAEIRFVKMAKSEWNVGITNDQLAWRRKKMADLKSLFPQEFPESDEDAFRTSGSKFFDYKKTHRLLLEAKAYLQENPPVEETDDYIQFESPDRGSLYVAGADTADSGGDYCVLKIINVTKKREAFVFRARCGVDHFSRVCDKWGRIFNNALMCPELNNHGIAVIKYLESPESLYPNLYAEEVPRHNVLGLDVRVKRIGWLTNASTKPFMLDHLKFAIEGDSQEDADHFQPSLLWLDQWLLNETLTIESRDAKIEAVAGEHDDDVMATAIAVQMFNLRRRNAHSEDNSTGFIVGGERESAKF